MKSKWIYLLAGPCSLLCVKAYSESYILEKNFVSHEFFETRIEQNRTAYSCEVQENSQAYKFIKRVLEIESSEQDDISKSGILEKSSLKVIEASMLSKSKNEVSINNIICLSDSSALALTHHLEVSNRQNNNGYLAIHEYRFVKEGDEFKLILPLEETENSIWFYMSETKLVESYFEVGKTNVTQKKAK